MIFALAGNQNCGKTTLFNQLTGSNQHVGNFPGVTVERKDGQLRGHRDVTVVDLPGIYSLSPYTNEEIGAEEFVDRAAVRLKEFMLADIKWDALAMYCELAHVDAPENVEQAVAETPLRLIVPAYMTQELQRAFFNGFLLYIPFLLIDVIVASTLMSMGMIMLPPAMISTPFKLLLFISVNGWDLMFSTLVQSVN